MRFLDTLAFMPSSLSKLVDIMNPYNIDDVEDIEETKINKAKQLKDEITNIDVLRVKFKNTSEHFKDDKQFLLMIKKGIYPYDYITSYDVLKEIELPSQDKFYSTLSNSECSDSDYANAKYVWKTFNCKTMMDYHNIYLSSDVLLLSDVWQTFNETCYKIYGLDPNYYYTAPSLSWDAFLKHTTKEYKKNGKKIQIELISDMDIVITQHNTLPPVCIYDLNR